MRILNYLVLTLSIIGCINWGLVGLFDINLVSAIFGMGSIITRAIYILVGICGIYQSFLAYMMKDNINFLF